MTSKTTITEALQELKTLDKRIASTRDFIVKYGIRQGWSLDRIDAYDESKQWFLTPDEETDALTFFGHP